MNRIELNIKIVGSLPGDTQYRAVANKWKFQDTMMGEQFITTTITSEKPISWAIGDYCVFRGETFTLNYIPSATQKGGTNQRQDSYTYENVKFDSRQEELTRCLMLDITPTNSSYDDAQGTNYTGSSNFQLYCGETTVGGVTRTAVCTLADKMQSNLDRLFGSGTWTIQVNLSTTHTDDKVLSFNNMTVAQALAEVHNTFELNYSVKGRTISIGYALKNLTGDDSSDVFAFGYGKGYPTHENPGTALTQIKRIANSSQQIVTRLRALGSTKNLPYRYYNKKYELSQSLFPTNLQLPDTFLPEGTSSDAAGADTKWGKYKARNNPLLRRVKGATNDAYLDKDDDAANCAEGIREYSVVFDGSGNLEEIYPTIEGAIYSELRTAGVEDMDGNTSGSTSVYFAHYGNSERVDELLAVGRLGSSQLLDDANVGDGILTEAGKLLNSDFLASIPATRLRYRATDSPDFTPGESYYSAREVTLFTISDVAAGNYAMAPTENTVFYGFSFDPASVFTSGKVGYIIKIKQVVEGTETLLGTYVSSFTTVTDRRTREVEMPSLPDVENYPNAQVPIIEVTAKCNVVVTFTPIVKDVVLSEVGNECNFIYYVGNSTIGEGTTYQPKYNWFAIGDTASMTDAFHVIIKDMGFDLSACFNGDTPKLSMKSGSCVGREFEIGSSVVEVEYTRNNQVVKGRMLTLKRDQDSSLNTYYPNENAQITAGDKFVLINIDMPDAYVEMAEARLLVAATNYLAENCETSFTYQPSLDDIYIQRNYDNMVAAGTVSDSIFWRLYAGLKFSFNGIPVASGTAAPSADITIETVTISMGEGLTPKVDLKLNDDIQQTAIQKLTASVNKIYSEGLPNVGNVTINPSGYLSSVNEDTAQGRITFAGGLSAITAVIEVLEVPNAATISILNATSIISEDVSLESLSVNGISITKDSNSNLLLGGNTKVSGNLTVTGNSSLGTVTSGTWQGTAIEYAKVAAHYIGRTRTQSSSAAQVLTGITQYQFEGQSGSEIGFEVVTVSVNGSNVRAIHTTLPFYSDSWIASGGVGSGGGGGGGGGGGSISLVISGSENGSVLTNLSINSAGDTLTATKGDIGLNSLSNVTLSSPSSGQILTYNGSNWVNSAAPATGVTSVGLTMPTGFSVESSPITSSGTIAVSFANGYSLPSTESQTSWNNAVTTANNAASAITAINARTIWGQTFNGNVSGNMTGVGTINGYSLGGTIANNNNGFVTGDAVYDYAAKAILFGGTTYTQSGGLITITTANIISAIGTAPVARATADASGNTITTTYATKSELASVESDVLSANNAIAENRARIEDIEAWKVAPTANTAYINSLGVNTINLDGIDVWRESDVVNVGGNIKAKISTSSDVSVKAENSSGQIGLVASNGIRGLYNVTGTSGYVIATNGTNTKLLLGNVSIGTDFQNGYKFFVSGNSYFQGNITTSGAATINNTLTAIGATSLQSTLTVSSSTTLQSALSVGGNTTLGGTLGVTGEATFSDIIRLNGTLASGDGNKRKIHFGTVSFLELVDLGSGNNPRYALHANVPFYSDSWVASGGIGSGGGGGGGASTLNDLDDVTITGTPQAGQILTYENNAWRNVTPSYNYAASVKVGNTTYQSQNNLVTIPFSVVSPVPTLSWGQEVQIASLAGKDIKIKLPSEPSYSLPAATSGALGGIKIGYGESSANRAVKLDNNTSQAYITLTGSGIAEVLGTTAVTNATNATNAVTATNLASAPSLSVYNTTKIKVTAGGKTSAEFTVPFATVASKLGTTQVGSSTIPIYIDSNGLPQTIQYTLGAACEKGIATSVNSTNTNLVTSQAVYNYLLDFATNAELEATNNAVAENRLRIADLDGWKANPTANTAYVKRLGVEAINLDGVDIWREAAVAVVGGGIAAQKTTTSDTFVKARNSNGEIGLLTSSNRGVYDFSRTEEVNGVTQSSPKWLITTNGTNTRLSCGNVAIGDSFNNNYKFYVNGTTYLNGATTISDTLTFNGSNRKIVFNSGTNECYLVYDSSNNAVHIKGNLYADGWVASGGIGTSGGGGGASTLNDLDDVQIIGTPVGGQILKYNGTSHQWENSTETLGGLQSVSASTTDSNPSYVLTSISKSGTAVTSTKAAIYYNKVSLNGSTQSIVTSTSTAVSFYAPTTAGTAGYYLMSNGSGAPSWAEMSVTHLNKAASLTSSDSANRVMTAAGLEFYSTAQQTSDTPTQLSVGTGALVQWVRYVSNSSGTYNTVSQLFTPISSNRLFYRNSWASGHYPGSGGDTSEWKSWLEVATIGSDGSGSLASNLIHSYSISTSSNPYTTGYVFSTKNLVPALYDNSDNLIVADVAIEQDTTSSSSTYGKYRVKVSFQETIPAAFRLVVYGL